MRDGATRGHIASRAGMLLTLFVLFLIPGCDCDKSIPPDPKPFPDLPTVRQNINASEGGVVETEGYEVEFPAQSLSENSEVTLGAPGETPDYPAGVAIEQASSFLNLDIGSATLVDTCDVYLVYDAAYDATNPPMPLVFASDGSLIDIAEPSPSGTRVRLRFLPVQRENNWTFALFDYVEPVDEAQLRIPQGREFDYDSSEPVVLLIHGLGGDGDVFDEDPHETSLLDYMMDAYNGRVWIWEYQSYLSVGITASQLVDRIADLESAHGDFPFKIHAVVHSMGGLEIRYAVRYSLGEKVSKVVFLGTPNSGTTLPAAVWYLVTGRSRTDWWWFNPYSNGFFDCLSGSLFLGLLNLPTAEPLDIEYHMIAGASTQGSPVILGEDDRLVGVSSVDLHTLGPLHEDVELFNCETVDLYHGQLIRNKLAGGLFDLIGAVLELESEETGTIVVDPDPDHLNAPWELDGPGSYFHSDSGDKTLSDMDVGSYTLTWGGVSGYITPSPNPETHTLDQGVILNFVGTYMPNLDGRIVFSRDSQLCTMNADGSDVQRVTEEQDICPDWSPDGTRVAFARCHSGAEPDAICVVNADGSGLAQLTHGYDEAAWPDWSPDGEHILFTRDEELPDAWEVWMMRSDGGDPHLLTGGGTLDSWARWSPDGSRVAFASDRHGEYWDMEVYAMESDGSDVSRLTDSPGIKAMIAWSPDGSLIAFTVLDSDDREGADIGVVDLSTGTEVRLTDDQFTNWCPNWNPSGDKIVFSSNRFAEGGSRSSICVMDADGGNVIPLTGGEHRDYYPDWTTNE